MGTRRITVRIDEQLQERLDAMAQTTGKSESQIVREAIAAYCTQPMVGQRSPTRCAGAPNLVPPYGFTTGERPNCYDLAKSLGIIGTIKFAPSDLSTNRKYLKGMGCD